MSSKTKAQKTAAQKPDAETNEEAANTEVTATGEETGAEVSQADATAQSDAAVETSDAAQPNEPDACDSSQPNEPVTESPEPVAFIETVAEENAPAATDGLSTRLTRAVNAILTSGKPDAVHALHKTELLLGTLKMSLPAAIEACGAIGDEALKADLKNLLDVL